MDLPVLYKNCGILLRSVYSALRVLPANKFSLKSVFSLSCTFSTANKPSPPLQALQLSESLLNQGIYETSASIKFGKLETGQSVLHVNCVFRKDCDFTIVDPNQALSRNLFEMDEGFFGARSVHDSAPESDILKMRELEVSNDHINEKASLPVNISERFPKEIFPTKDSSSLSRRFDSPRKTFALSGFKLAKSGSTKSNSFKNDPIFTNPSLSSSSPESEKLDLHEDLEIQKFMQECEEMPALKNSKEFSVADSLVALQKFRSKRQEYIPSSMSSTMSTKPSSFERNMSDGIDEEVFPFQ